jgi:hypothetical protein
VGIPDQMNTKLKVDSDTLIKLQNAATELKLPLIPLSYIGKHQ